MTEQKLRILKFFFLILFFLQIFYIYEFRSGFKFEIFKNPFGKDSGITFSLPPQAIESSNYIKKYQLDNFNLSDEIKNNNALYQRIIEFNYPVKFKNKSNIYFSLKQENLLDNCKIIDQGEYLILNKC